MKRFFFDFCIIVCMVLIGMEINNSSENVTRNEKIEQFEENLKRPEKAEKEAIMIYQTKENHAGKLAETTSNLILQMSKSIVIVMSSLFEVISET